MAGIFQVSSAPIQNTRYPVNVRPHAQSLRALRTPGGNTVADALDQTQAALDQIFATLTSPLPAPQQFGITDQSGALIAWIGNRLVGSQQFLGGWFKQLYVGGGSPATAPFFADTSGRVVVGQNGQVFVLDAYGNTGAWLGTQSEGSQNVSGAVAATGAIRLTVTGHGYRNGDWVNVASVGGVPNATGQWLISVYDANHFDLLGSTFSGAYTSGGTVNRFFGGGAFETLAVAAGQRITNAANNGSGLVRLTIPSHGYATGYALVVSNVGGVPGANGPFLATVIDANTVDLQGSEFSGLYTSGGIAINWPTAKLLAQGDGSLLLQNARITSVSSGNEVLIDSGEIVVGIAGTPIGVPLVAITPGQVQVEGDDTNGYQVLLTSGTGSSQIQVVGNADTFARSNQVTLSAYTQATGYGPIFTINQARGTATSPGATQSGDTVGGWIVNGYGTSTLGAAAIYVVAAENWTASNHGAYLTFQTTPSGGSSTAEVLRLFGSGGMALGSTADPGAGIFLATGGLLLGTTHTPSLTPNASGQITIAAAGSNQNIVLTPSGTGCISSIGPMHLDPGTSTQYSHVLLQANGAGALSAQVLSAGNVQLLFDAYRSAGSLLAANTAAARIVENAGNLSFQAASGLTVGSPVVFTTAVTIQLSTGFAGFGGNTSAAYPVDATGSINASGAYLVGGTQVVGSRRTGWTIPTATLSRSGLTNSSTATQVLETLAALVTDLMTTGIIGT
jgi:hypothetical protein